MTEANVLEELSNIVDNAPVFAGDTISHMTARECQRRGWAERNWQGDWIATRAGRERHWTGA